jgi:hypothetical protein
VSSNKTSSPGPLLVESLESTLKAVTFDTKHLKLWPVLPRCSCPNTYQLIDDADQFVARNRLFQLLHKLLHERHQ